MDSFNYTDVAIENISSDTIRLFALDQSKYSLHNQYDTTIHLNLSDYWNDCILCPGDKEVATFWEEHDRVSRDTITIFVVDNRVYDTVPWDSIAKNYMVLQRYDVPAQYYMEHFWPRKHLTYPPTDEMCDIPMWPAYHD